MKLPNVRRFVWCRRCQRRHRVRVLFVRGKGRETMSVGMGDAKCAGQYWRCRALSGLDGIIEWAPIG